MPYYVLGPGGAKYGPVELDVLNVWVQQGRISSDTLLEDGGGVKMPARAIKGLPFSVSSSPTIAPSLPTQMNGQDIPHTPFQPAASNYLRPGQGTGGGSNNLFVPGINANWASQGYIALAVGLGVGVLSSVLPFEIFRLTYVGLGSCIYGATRGYVGSEAGQRGKGLLLIALNAVAFFIVVGLMVYKFIR